MKILLIDDDSNDRMLTKHELNKTIPQIKYTEIWNRDQFDVIMKDFSYDLVLTDYLMLGWSGLYVLKAVKALNPDIPVIMYTGTGNEEVAVSAMKMGLDDYVMKGRKRLPRLSVTVKSIINQKRSENSRRKAQEALRETAVQIRLLLDSTVEGIYSIDGNGFATLINKAAMKMLGIKHKNEFIGKKVHWLIHHSDAAGEQISEENCPIIQAGKDFKSVHRAKDLFWRTDGTYFPVEYWGYPILKNKQYMGNVVTFFDITDRIDTQQKLSVALTKAEQTVIVKNNFLANISHEIRTPLNAIMGFADVLSNLFKSRATEEENLYFQIIDQACERLLHTVHQILDISTIEAGAYEIYSQKPNLAKLIKETMIPLQWKAAAKNIKLHWKSSVKNASVLSDSYCIRQAVECLIDNAIKYTETGYVEIHLNSHKPWYVITIRDTGVGIPKDYLDRIFDIFSQGSEGYSKKYQGVGLGLSLVRRYIDLCNGYIDVESEIGVGTIFTLKFKQYRSK